MGHQFLSCYLVSSLHLSKSKNKGLGLQGRDVWEDVVLVLLSEESHDKLYFELVRNLFCQLAHDIGHILNISGRLVLISISSPKFPHIVPVAFSEFVKFFIVVFFYFLPLLE